MSQAFRAKASSAPAPKTFYTTKLLPQRTYNKRDLTSENLTPNVCTAVHFKGTISSVRMAIFRAQAGTGAVSHHSSALPSTQHRFVGPDSMQTHANRTRRNTTRHAEHTKIKTSQYVVRK